MSNLKCYALAAMLLMISGPLVSGEVNDTIKEQIVVQTPLQNYEQPSMRDYEECHMNRENCLNVCDGKEKCESECPICPELSDNPLLVQGVNDTSYAPPAQPAVNTTNIIRLTNEIKNIINTDILARNEINVKVHQNVSQVGGRFGLGYNEHGSCCHVVRKDRECEHKDHCPEVSRQRVCGQRCQARVMIAKRVVQCDKDQTEDCHETIEYVPARKHKSQSGCRSNGNCHSQSKRVKRANCKSCLNIPYGYIIQNGVPPKCGGCFQGYGAPIMYMPVLYAPAPNYGYNYAPQFDGEDYDQEQDGGKDVESDSGWVLKSQECKNEKGELEDCMEASGDGNNLIDWPAHLEQGDYDKNNNNDNNINIDDEYDVPIQRRRRRQSRRRHGSKQFIRSLYSRRHSN